MLLGAILVHEGKGNSLGEGEGKGNEMEGNCVSDTSTRGCHIGPGGFCLYCLVREKETILFKPQLIWGSSL